MTTHPITVDAFVIPDAEGLDPITVILQTEFEMFPQALGLTVECFGASWSCFWPNSVRDARRFICKTDRFALADCLLRGRRQLGANEFSLKRERGYLLRIVDALQLTLREQKNMEANHG